VRDILDTFEQHVTDVQRLISFDSEVMHVAISTVEELHRTLKKNNQNDQMNGGRTLQILRGIRNNESLKPRFSLILNQAVVLLVSYFGSAVDDIFRRAVAAKLSDRRSSRLLKEELKLTVAELLELSGEHESIADLLVDKKDLSFQDMQAIQLAFRDYLDVEIPKDRIVNNIILAQACRHVIVHAGGEVNARLKRQVSGALPRDLKDQLSEKVVQFSEQEVEIVAESMRSYIASLVGKVGDQVLDDAKQ
jgi:hypothetical protein